MVADDSCHGRSHVCVYIYVCVSVYIYVYICIYMCVYSGKDGEMSVRERDGCDYGVVEGKIGCLKNVHKF